MFAGAALAGSRRSAARSSDVHRSMRELRVARLHGGAAPRSDDLESGGRTRPTIDGTMRRTIDGGWRPRTDTEAQRDAESMVAWRFTHHLVGLVIFTGELVLLVAGGAGGWCWCWCWC